MRLLIQRVKHAKVEVETKTVGEIQKGLLLLLGVENADSDEDIEWLARKIIDLRIFNDADGKMNLSVKDIEGELLVVSQFTLHASTKRGNRPSFIQAANAEWAAQLYENFKKELSNRLGKEVATGVFGADMQVSLLNDGPVTILMDSKNKE